MMSSVFLSRIIGLFREMVLAGYGGTSAEMDVYITSFIIPDLLNHFLAGGFLSITFIPIFQRYIAENRNNDAWESFSNLFCTGSLLFLAVVPVIMFFTPNLVHLFGPHISQGHNFDLTVRLTRIILPAQLFFYWGAFFSAVQMAQKKFFLPALLPLVYNAGIIAGGLVLVPRIGVEGFAWGVVAGALAGNIMLQLPGALAAGMRFNLRINLFHPDLRLYIVKSLPLILGLGLSFSNEFFFRYFGSHLSEGATSSVNYAFRTMMIVVAIFGQASGVALFPFLSQLAAEKKFGEMAEMLNNLLTRIAQYLVPASILLMLTARNVISLLFERGKFDTASTDSTASLLILYLAGSFFFSASIIIARAFYAMQNMILPMVVSTGVALITVPLYIGLSSAAGATGIVAAAVAGMVLQFAVLFGIWNRKFGSLQTIIREGAALLKICGCTAGAALAGKAITHFFTIDESVSLPTILSNLKAIMLIALPYLLTLVLLYHFFGIQKLDSLLKRLHLRT